MVRVAGFGLAIGLGGSMLCSTAWAQAESPRDRLIDLATIEITHELCGFDLSDAQQDAITAQRGKMTDDGETTDAEIAAVREDLAPALARQVPEGLCKAGGPGERFYRQAVGKLGAE